MWKNNHGVIFYFKLCKEVAYISMMAGLSPRYFQSLFFSKSQICTLNSFVFKFFTLWASAYDKIPAEKNINNRIHVFLDKEPALAQLFNASSIPLMLFIPKNGKPFTVTGLRPKEQITDIINEKLEVKITTVPPAPKK